MHIDAPIWSIKAIWVIVQVPTIVSTRAYVLFPVFASLGWTVGSWVHNWPVLTFAGVESLRATALSIFGPFALTVAINDSMSVAEASALRVKVFSFAALEIDRLIV